MEAPAGKEVSNTAHPAVTHDEEAKTVTTPPAAHESIEDEPAPHLHAKTYVIVLAVSFLSFALLIQLVACGAFASTIAQVVGGADISGWLFTSLTITFVVLAPPVSHAADYWGRRWLLIILAVAGMVGCIITSRAQSMGVAILGEVFVGASFAATPLTFAVASEVLPHRHRLTGQAVINVGSSLGAVFSLLVGGRLVQNSGPAAYRILYYINAGVYAAAAIVIFICYRPPLRELQATLSSKEKLRRLDWLGYFITGCAAVLFCMGLEWALNPYAWNDAHVLAPFLMGIACFGFLAVYAWKLNRSSYIPAALFSRNRNCALAFVCVFLEGLSFGGANSYVPFQTSVLYETKAFNVTFLFSIALMGYGVFSPIGAILCYRFKLVRSLLVTGFVCLLLFFILAATSTLASGTAFWGYQVFLGAGLAFVLNAVVTAAQLSAPAEYISITSGLITAIRSLGASLSGGIFGAIFHTRLSKLLPSKIAAAALAKGLPKSSLPALITDLVNQETDALAQIPGNTPAITEAAVGALKEAYLQSFKSVWTAACCFVGLAFLISLCFANPTQDLTNHIDAPVESEEDLYG